MKLQVNNGMVAYMMEAGKDAVSAQMPEDKARKIIAKGPKRTSSRFPGYPICVNDRYFFAAEKPVKKSKV